MEEGNTEIQEPKTQERPQQMRHEGLKPEIQDLGLSERGWLGRLKERFSGVLNKERKAGEQNISIDMFYNRHRSDEETKGIEKQFQNADIFIPEVFGWTQKYLDHLRKLSNGEVTPDELLEMMGTVDPNEYARDKNLFDLLYNKKKAIDIIDLPYDHPLRQRIDANKFPEIQFGTGFGQTLVSVRDHIEESAVMEQEREAYMIEQLQQLTQNLKTTHPKLKDKKNINILMSIGGGHLQLPHKLKNKYQAINASSTAPKVFYYYDETLIRQMSDMPVDDDLIIKSIAERMLSKKHKKLFVTSDSLEDSRSIRKLVSRFSFDELKEMFEGAKDINEWADMFLQGLKKPVKVPAAVK